MPGDFAPESERQRQCSSFSLDSCMHQALAAITACLPPPDGDGLSCCWPLSCRTALQSPAASVLPLQAPDLYQPDTSPPHQHCSLPPTACRRMFAQAIMVGYMSKEGKVLHINPREDSRLEEGDSVIVLSQSRESSCCPFCDASLAYMLGALRHGDLLPQPHRWTCSAFKTAKLPSGSSDAGLHIGAQCVYLLPSAAARLTIIVWTRTAVRQAQHLQHA